MDAAWLVKGSKRWFSRQKSLAIYNFDILSVILKYNDIINYRASAPNF